MSADFWFDPEYPDELPPEADVPEGDEGEVDDDDE
jgi:hypothetical protein